MPWILGIASAICTAGVVITVVLVAHLILARAGAVSAESPSRLATWLIGDGVSWPWFGRYDYCLLSLLAVFLACCVCEAAIVAVMASHAHRLAATVVDRLQRSLHAQAARLTPAPLLDRSPQLATDGLSAPMEAVQSAIAHRWSTVPRDWSLAVVLAAASLAVDLFFTLLGLLLAIVTWRMLQRFRMRTEQRQQVAKERVVRRRSTMDDRLRTASIVPLFAPGVEAPDGYDAERRKYNAEVRHTYAGRSRLILASSMVMACAAAMMLLVLGLATEIRLTDFAFLVAAFVRVCVPVLRLKRLKAEESNGEYAAEQILGCLDRTPEVGQAGRAKQAPPLNQELRLVSVSLSDGNESLLQDVTLTLPAGSFTAVVSTDSRACGALAALILRHRDPSLGRITIDGLDLRELELDTLRQRFSFAAHDGLLYTSTITANIRCGRNKYSESDVAQAAAHAQVLDSIELLPHGLQTVVGPDGRNLPADQAFQIGFARALISEPTLLVIDEPAPAHTGEHPFDAQPLIKSAREGRTVVALARQLDTLRNADQVVLLHAGTIHAQGKHADLLKNNALYRHLNYEWFNTFREIDTKDVT